MFFYRSLAAAQVKVENLSENCRDRIYEKMAENINTLEIGDLPLLVAVVSEIEFWWVSDPVIREKFYPHVKDLAALVSNSDELASLVYVLAILGSFDKEYYRDNHEFLLNFQDLLKYLDKWVPLMDANNLSLFILG